METRHIPVLLDETLNVLSVKPDGTYIDGTVGFGGHSFAIASRLNEKGKLYCIDRDPDALAASGERLSAFKNVSLVKGNFADMAQLLKKNGTAFADGILLDIGVSSYQLDSAERGFSFHTDAPLDMRMSKAGVTAAELCNTLPESELVRILFEYGEEKFARRIASGIVKARDKAPILTTLQLAEIVKNAYPAAKRRDGHPARQTFQALRIAVNGELDALKNGIESAAGLLKAGGVMAIITFHSLEDRIVKQSFNEMLKGCVCPPDFPVCVCHRTPFAEKVTTKPVTATEKELAENPRSRSAKLRAIRRIKDEE